MAIQDVTPGRKYDLPLESQLTGAGARMLAYSAPYSYFGAGYQLLPDQSMGQIYMPGPNATLFGNNPFGLSPYGQGYFGGAYNSISPNPSQPGMGGYSSMYPQMGGGANPFYGGLTMPQGNGYQAGNSYPYIAPQPQPAGQSYGPQQMPFSPPAFGQAGFPYWDFANWQQGFGQSMGQGYFQNPWPGYGYGGSGGAGGGMGGPPSGGGGVPQPGGPPSGGGGVVSSPRVPPVSNNPNPSNMGGSYSMGGNYGTVMGGGQRIYGYPGGPADQDWRSRFPLWQGTPRPPGGQPSPTQGPIPASSPYGWKYAGNQPPQPGGSSTTVTGTRPGGM